MGGITPEINFRAIRSLGGARGREAPPFPAIPSDPRPVRLTTPLRLTGVAAGRHGHASRQASPGWRNSSEKGTLAGRGRRSRGGERKEGIAGHSEGAVGQRHGRREAGARRQEARSRGIYPPKPGCSGSGGVGENCFTVSLLTTGGSAHLPHGTRRRPSPTKQYRSLWREMPCHSPAAVGAS